MSVDIRELELVKELHPLLAEQVGELMLDVALGEDVVGAVLGRGAKVHEIGPAPHQFPQIPGLQRGLVGLGYEVGSKEVREHPGVKLVRLYAGGRYSPGLQGVAESVVDAYLVQEIAEPVPVRARLEDRTDLWAHTLEETPYLGLVRRDL